MTNDNELIALLDGLDALVVKDAQYNGGRLQGLSHSLRSPTGTTCRVAA